MTRNRLSIFAAIVLLWAPLAQAAMSSACGNLNITTGAAASTVVVSGLAFQPKVIIFWSVGLTAASNGTRATARRMVGAAVSASSYFCQANFDTDGVGTSVSKNNYSASYCVMEIDNTGAIVGGASTQSLDSGGFTLVIGDQFVTNLLVSWVAYGGTDITNVETGTFTNPGATGNQTTNNSGNFQPSITFFFIGHQVNSGAGAIVLIGAATSSANDHVHYSAATDANGSGATGSYNRSGECFVYRGATPAASPTVRGEFVSHNSSPGGFTVNYLETVTVGTTVYQWLSIKGGTWIVGDLLSQTDTTTTITESGFGIQPESILQISACKAETVADAAPGTHDQFSMGAWTSTSNRVVQGMDSRSGNTSMFVHPFARTDAIYQSSSPANTNYTVDGTMDSQSVGSDGFTNIMADADSAQFFSWYVSTGNVPAGGTLPPLLNSYRQRRP